MNRLAKQLLYGLLYLTLFSAIGFGVYFLALKPVPTCFDNKQNQSEERIDCGGPCQSCELKELQSLKSSTPVILESGENLITVVFEIRNPNSNYGADKFNYTLNFYDSADKNLFSLSKESFVYPSQIKTFVEAGLRADFKKISRSEVVIGDLSWRPRLEFIVPQMQAKEIKVERDKTGIAVSGIVVNENAFNLAQVGISVVVYDSNGLEKGASRTVLQSLEAFERKSFKVFIPTQIEVIDAKLTKVFLEAGP